MACDFVPIDNVPPGLDVVRAAVLIFQIVGMFPDIQAEDWRGLAAFVRLSAAGIAAENRHPQQAEADFDRQFRQRQAPEEIDEFDATNLDLVTTLVDSGLAPSGRGEARRLVSQEGVRVNGVKVGLDHRFEDGQTLSVGKRKFIRIRVR